MRMFVVGIVVSSALSLTAATNVAGQEQELTATVLDAITRERLDAHAREITRYERPSGSSGENAATDYIAATLAEQGVPFEVHEFMGYTSNPISASVTVPGTDFDPQAITMSFSGATDGVEGIAVDLGALSDLPELEIGTGERLFVRDARGFEHVRGKVVIVTGQARNVPTRVLQQLGAVAAIFVNPEERLNDLIVTSTWGIPSLMSQHRLPTLPVAHIMKSDGDRLRAMMASADVTVRVRTEVDAGWKPLRLSVARIMPDGADAATPYVLLGGHIDGWYYGGTDEGASNAAMLQMAIAYHQNRERMKHGLVVAWWPGHSNARYAGSTWFADTFFDELRTRGLAYLNIDGVGQIDAQRFGASTSPALATLATDVVGGLTGQSVRPGRPGRNSDQAFNGIGLPLLQFSHARSEEDGGYWWWHTPDDTYDKIDFDVLRTDTELYVTAISELVAAPAYPASLPFELDALADALTEREAESDRALDLSEARARVDRLREVWTDAFPRGLVTEDPTRALDVAILRALRPLHRIMFVPGSDYHPGPGIYGRPLPGLEPVRILAEEDPSSDRYRFAMAQLLRERNRILEAIDEATRAATDLIERRAGS
jgi:N-acetylated-alpha-linked acidic dipeptidase